MELRTSVRKDPCTASRFAQPDDERWEKTTHTLGYLSTNGVRHELFGQLCNY